MQPFLFLSACALIFPLLTPGHNFHSAQIPAYAQRGNEVEALFALQSNRLAKYHEKLKAALSARARDLLGKLEKSDVVMPGYQVLPKIASRANRNKQTWASAVAYSWPWTAHLIENELRAIDSADAELRAIDFKPDAQRRILERLVQNYMERSFQHRNIAAHIAYNRFWQEAIAADRPAYDRETSLQRVVMERQRIQARLQRVRATFANPGEPFFRQGSSIRLVDIERDLSDRSELLARRIDEALREMRSPPFLRMEKSDRGWIFRMPLFTDIADEAFVDQVKQIIESTWRLPEGETAYAVHLEVTYLSPDALYGGSEPKAGERVDLSTHLAKFPPNGAILTTGGITTHARDRAIILGPHPLTPGIVAHEFGHVLGFRDRYVRGYKNLGKEGFQVLEIVADPEDIMAATSQGLVREKHFSRLAAEHAKAESQFRRVERLERVRAKPGAAENAEKFM